MGFWLRLGCLLLKAIYVVLERIYRYANPERLLKITPWDHPLSQLSAVRVAELIRRREFSSESVVRAYVERIKEVNRWVNAVVDERFEEALKEARQCDEQLRSAKSAELQELREKKPLFGVPITVKESCSLKGMSLTGGSTARRGVKADADGAMVKMLRSAGAIPLCVTNTSELCASFDSDNLVNGRTRNPYDLRRTVGGSSGGEGALLGAGASMIGVGSDIAGSIRLPALFNGVFGHKPTTGVVPLTGHYPFVEDKDFQKYLVIGPLARYVEDLHLFMKIASANCPRDLRLDEPVDVSKLRVFHAFEMERGACRHSTSSDIRESIVKAVDYLRERKASIETMPESSFDKSMEILTAALFGIEAMPKILLDPNNPKEEKNPHYELIKGAFGLSNYTKSSALLSLINGYGGMFLPSNKREYQEMLPKFSRYFTELLGEDGILLMPIYPYVAPLKDLVVLTLGEASYALLANICGFPATQVPMGTNREGIPVGFQVIAGPYQDRICLAVARELAKKFGGWTPPSES